MPNLFLLRRVFLFSADVSTLQINSRYHAGVLIPPLSFLMVRQALFFAIAGVVGLMVDIAVLYMLRDAIGPFYGRGASFVAAVVATWLVNRSVTFHGRRSGLPLQREFASYFSLMLAGGAVNYAVYSALVVACDIVRQHLFLGVAAGSLAGMVVNFMTSRYLLFRRSNH